MKLHKVANEYNTLTVSDAYGVGTFKAQFDPLSLSKIDGVQVRKRSISTAPDVVVPARGVVRINGDEYLIGEGAPDFWENSIIRKTYVIQGADGLANLTSVAGKLANTAPATAYAALAFSKYLPDANDNSRMPPQYQVFLAGSENAPADSLIELGTSTYLVKQSYISTSGLRIALANALDEPVFETINYNAQTYDPVTDTYSGATTSVKIMRVKWSEHYTYLTKADETYQRGDVQGMVLKSAMPAAKESDVLALSDGSWRVLSVQDEGATLSMHLRRT